MVEQSEFSGPVTDRRGGQQPAPDDRRDIRTVLLVIIALVLVGWALRATSVVAVPLVASVLIALAVMPVRDWVQRKVPERFGWLGAVAAMALLLLVIAVFFGALWLAAQQVVGQFPSRAEQAMEQMSQGDSASGNGIGVGFPAGLPAGVSETGARASPARSAANTSPGEGSGDLLPGSAAELAQRSGDTIMSALAGIAATVLNSAVAIASGLVVIFFLTLLILIESDAWRQKIASITHRRNEWRLTESAEVIAHKVRVYLLVRATLGLITAVLYGLWLWLFGVGLVVVWVILTFLLNFIPTVGSIVAGLVPTVYAFVTQDFGTALAVGLGLLVIEQIMGNYVDPRVAGSRVAVSPLVVLMALLVWSWAWGIPGALLAVPVTVSFIVLGAHVPVLRPWALLLSDRTDMEGLKKATRPEADNP